MSPTSRSLGIVVSSAPVLGRDGSDSHRTGMQLGRIRPSSAGSKPEKRGADRLLAAASGEAGTEAGGAAGE